MNRPLIVLALLAVVGCSESATPPIPASIAAPAATTAAPDLQAWRNGLTPKEIEAVRGEMQVAHAEFSRLAADSDTLTDTEAQKRALRRLVALQAEYSAGVQNGNALAAVQQFRKALEGKTAAQLAGD